MNKETLRVIVNGLKIFIAAKVVGICVVAYNNGTGWPILLFVIPAFCIMYTSVKEIDKTIE